MGSAAVWKPTGKYLTIFITGDSSCGSKSPEKLKNGNRWFSGEENRVYESLRLVYGIRYRSHKGRALGGTEPNRATSKPQKLPLNQQEGSLVLLKYVVVLVDELYIEVRLLCGYTMPERDLNRRLISSSFIKRPPTVLGIGVVIGGVAASSCVVGRENKQRVRL